MRRLSYPAEPSGPSATRSSPAGGHEAAMKKRYKRVATGLTPLGTLHSIVACRL